MAVQIRPGVWQSADGRVTDWAGRPVGRPTDNRFALQRWAAVQATIARVDAQQERLRQRAEGTRLARKYRLI